MPRIFRPLRIALPLLALLCSLATPAHPQSFTVGTAVAAPGQKVMGFIEVPAGVDAAMRIPVVVVRGAKPGRVLALVSGAHGTEYVSIIAVEKLITRLDPADISGTVILVPLVNPASFDEKVPHVNPVDRKNMNRMYPGKADGTQSERAALLITRQVVEQCDYLIDLHGGDLDESLRRYSYWPRTGREQQDAVSRGMVLAFGLNHIIISDDRPTDPNVSRYLDSTASTRGKPAITVEAGYAGTVETDDVAALVEGSINVMRHLKFLSGNAAPVEHPVWLEKVVDVASEQAGIFYPLVKRGTYVEAGMKLGYVTDYFDRIIYEARAPVAGVLLHICAVPSMKKGDNLANIGVVAAKAP
jgi:predicted deacylase